MDPNTRGLNEALNAKPTETIIGKTGGQGFFFQSCMCLHLHI
jgi:hypothetical protein